jgi:hypothetical protein
MDPLVQVEPIEAGPSRAAPPLEGVRVRTAVGQRHGVDLTRVPIDRSSEGTAQAQQIRSRAFTSDRAIVIPPAAGTLETGPGEALLAHELTHVAQRARLGPDLPAETTPAGSLLELEALSAELDLAPGRPSPPDLPGVPRRPWRSGWDTDGGPAKHPGAGLPLVAPGANGADVDSLAASILDKLSVLTSPAPLASGTEVFTAPWSSGPASAPPPPAAVQRADQLTALAPPPPAQPAAQEEETGPFSTRPSEQELHNLSRWLYPLMKYKLKMDLREDRERAGLLTDHYRKW